MSLTEIELKEPIYKCCQYDCSEVATHKVYWPGQEMKKMCPIHAAKAKRIASLMNFYLHTEVME